MKKVASILICVCMILSCITVVIAADFNDLASDHWAYSYVDKLVNDGTINGFEDGSFRPAATVTRAQFVKMIGNGPEIRNEAFADVDSSHWAYNYIMSSGLEPVSGNMFEPDTPITRGDVAVLLWKRAGAPKGLVAPPVVNRQSNNHDAASWVYINGIMTGDDNINLRLSDTLTRAEASALIVRSREVSDSTAKVDFVTAINQDLYKLAYDAFALSDRAYDADATFTNGEMAEMAVRLACDEFYPSYTGMGATRSFTHKHAMPVNALSRYCWPDSMDSISEVDKTATLGFTIAALMYAVSFSSDVVIPEGTDNYPSIPSSADDKTKRYLSMAYSNGVFFTADKAMNLNKEVTMREFAALLIQMDGFSGIYTCDVVGEDKGRYDMTLNTAVNTYPEAASRYKFILNGIPDYVYNTAYVSENKTPAESYSSVEAVRPIFTSMIASVATVAKQNGVSLNVEIYPGLAVNNGNGYTLRVKLIVKSAAVGSKLSDVAPCINPADGEKLLASGDVIYVDIDTGKKLDDIVFPVENVAISQIVG